MAVLLSQLYYNTRELYGLKLLAGKERLKTPVRWVHIIEDTTTPEFLKGNELIFTTGIGQSGTSWMLPYVHKLWQNRAAGVVFTLGQFLPEIPAPVTVWCEQHNLPLFVTSWWDVLLIDVTYDFCHRIIQSEKREISLIESFRAIIFTPERLEEYAATLEGEGFDRDEPYCILAMQIISNQSEANNIQLELRQILRDAKVASCLFRQNPYYILIRQHTDETAMIQLAQRAADYLQREKYVVRIGISGRGRGFPALSRLYHQATSAVKIARMEHTPYAHYKDLGIFQLLFDLPDPAMADRFANDTLGPLLRYDAEHETDFLTVLDVYLLKNSSVQETAHFFQVHRNTINAKIKQIREILQTEFTDTQRETLRLALCLRKLKEPELYD